MGIIESIITAISLCADCFAVSLCSSVTIKRIEWKNVGAIAFAFALIQTGLLCVGFAFGSMLSSLVSAIAHIIGFALLMYVAVSMLIEGIRGKEEQRDLNGLKNVIVGGLATSIDAFAVGISQSIEGQRQASFAPLAIAVFVVTALSVLLGICGGKRIGCRFGRWAEVAGGTVLAIIAILLLLLP